jgi:SAM-dependent methyltransferase
MSTTKAGRHTGLSSRLFAWFFAHAGSAHEELVVEKKRALLGELQGSVLEIGPGTGANLGYYPVGVHWIGVEPNPYMHTYLRKEAARLNRTVDLRLGVAEQLPAADGSVDAVVGTLVLCSVDQLSQSLQEILRVLRPGGRFVFIEHVAAPRSSRLRRIQRAIRPVWGALADGCHPDRETWAAVDSAGFSRVHYEHFRIPAPIVGPHIAGVAIK